MMALLALVLVLLVIGGGLLFFTVRTVRRVETALPPVGRFVDVPGARLHVVDRGSGAPLLLVHGLAGQLGHFTFGIVDQLAAQYRVVAVDRPGSGYSLRMPGTSAALNAQADALATLIDTLQLGRAVVVGHSLGGAVALALAQRHPQRVAGLALVAPLAHPVEGVPAVFRGLTITKPWMRVLVAWTLAVPMGIAKRDAVLSVLFGPEAVPSDFGTRAGGLLALRPSHFLAACADLQAIPEDLDGIVQRYAGMQLPVDILYGRGDGILNPGDQGESLAAKLPGARLTLIDGGHMLPITAPDRTAQFIREAAARARFLASGATAPSTASAPESAASTNHRRWR